MRRMFVAGLLALLALSPATAGERVSTFDTELAARSAQIETLRARSALTASSAVSTGLIEADDLLRRLRQASADKRPALSSQLDAALARLELEIDAARRGSR